MSYREKLLDPRWQKKRLLVLERDEFTCQRCYDSMETLHVHHRYYAKSGDPWDVPDEALITLCASCHEFEGRVGPENERLLLIAVRRHFLTDEVYRIASAIRFMQLLHLPYVVANAICLTLTHPELQGEMIGMTDRWLERRRKSAEAVPTETPERTE